MYAVGVTGGVASGKTMIDQCFSQLGIIVVDADRIAREVVEPGQPAWTEIRDAFGPASIGADGRLARASLRALVFEDASARRKLEAITHPQIRARLFERCAAAGGPYVVASIPLLAEAAAERAYAWLARVLVVDAPDALRVARLCRRDGIDAALARRMLAAQAPRHARLAIASDVLVNDASPEHAREAVVRLDAVFRRGPRA